MTSFLKTTTFAALALTAFALPASQAALNYNPDDLFLSFHQAGNTTKEYVIDLGQASFFRDATTPFSLSLLSISSSSFNLDMIAAFGASWKTSGDILWGLAGTTQNTAVGSDAIRLVYVSQPINASVPTASSSQSGPANNIINFKSNWTNNSISLGSVPNSSIESPTDTNSWTNSISNPAGPFGTGAFTPLEDVLGNPLNLYRVPQTTTGQSVTNEGTFTIDFNSATISFAPTVPEPTSAALVCGALLTTLGFRRRRTSVTA